MRHTTFCIKKLLPALLLSFVCTLGLGQVSNGVYSGWKRMCETDKHGIKHCYDAPRKWYYVSDLYIKADSVFIYKYPVQLVKKDTLYSASDGGFHYYLGVIQYLPNSAQVIITKNNCDYCAQEITEDTTTGFTYPVLTTYTYPLTYTANTVTFNNTTYTRVTDTVQLPPYAQLFYFDSNSVYRTNPKGQYRLISTAIDIARQAGFYQLYNDTLYVCSERTVRGELVETLLPDSIVLSPGGPPVKYLTHAQLQQLAINQNEVIVYLELGEIIDYWKAARIQISKLSTVPNGVHTFHDTDRSRLFQFEKVNGGYRLAE